MHFWCPGCDEAHGITFGEGGWTWNGSVEFPTFSPSIKVSGAQWQPSSGFYKTHHSCVSPGDGTICHSYVTDGRIQFLHDCTHGLAGQTVELPEWPYN